MQMPDMDLEASRRNEIMLMIKKKASSTTCTHKKSYNDPHIAFEYSAGRLFEKVQFCFKKV